MSSDPHGTVASGAERPQTRPFSIRLTDAERCLLLDRAGRVLAALGQSRIASNLNQLAKAVNIGVLPVTPETEADMSEACAAVSAMRADLMRALGLVEVAER